MEKRTEVINPYERIKEIEVKIEDLNTEEKQLNELIRKGINKPNNGKRLDEVKSECLFLWIEEDCMKKAINWFEIYCLGHKDAQHQLNEGGSK